MSNGPARSPKSSLPSKRRRPVDRRTFGTNGVGLSRELCEALRVGGFKQCCGFDLGKDWDCFELCCPGEDNPERCPKPATCTYENGTERIPLCPEHYDAWCRDEAESGDGTSPVWWSQEWLEKYEDG